MFFDFSAVLVFLGVSALFLAALLAVGRLVRPCRPTPEKLSTYECGEEAIGTSRLRFNPRFFVVALVFLVFDVEIAVLFPWAALFGDPGARLLAFLEVLLFLGILLVGFAYVWVKGDLDWIRPPRGGGRREGEP